MVFPVAVGPGEIRCARQLAKVGGSEGAKLRAKDGGKIDARLRVKLVQKAVVKVGVRR